MMSVKAESKIHEVTVFRNGATVTRTTKVNLSKGEQTIIIEGITQYADPQSFRIKGTGPAILRSIDVERHTEIFEPSGQLKELVEKLKRLTKEREHINDELEIHKERVAMLMKTGAHFAKEFGKWYSFGESTIQGFHDFDESIKKRLGEAKQRIREINERLKDIDVEISEIHKNINKIDGGRETITTLNAKIMLDVKQQGEVALMITYQVNRAAWESVYDVNIQDNSTKLKKIAMIYNNSGEDWNDVTFHVSTAFAQPVIIVEPVPLYLEETGLRGPPSVGALPGTSGYLDTITTEKELQASVKDQLSGVIIYDIPVPVTVPFDDEGHPVTLTEEEYESKSVYYWNAYAMGSAVVMEEITNDTATLTHGKVRIYSKGDFLGESVISTIAPHEKFRLGARTAYDVKVKREVIEKETDKSGITKGKIKRHYAYMFKIENYAKEDIDIIVVDRIPYSRSERIKVELQEFSDEPTKNELGVLEWRLNIPASEKKEVSYRYVVEWEKDVTITPPLP